MTNPFYSYSAINDRPVMPLPDGKRIAVWIGLNVEHYEYGRPAMSLAPFTAELVPDPLNYAWREYGPRVGFWRMLEVFDRLGIQPTGILNSEVITQHPSIVAAGVQRDWTWVAHGVNNSTWQVGMDADAELAYISSVADAIEEGTGRRPRGWLGPSITSTVNTLEVLASLGFDYSLDWGFDDLPVPFDKVEGNLLSVPYSTELNDIPFYAIHSQSGVEFKQALIDSFDQLYAEGADRPRVLGVGLHPFLSGQPYRVRYVAEALEYFAQHDDVWFTTADGIADWYKNASPQA